MSLDSSNKPATIREVSNSLKVRFSHTINCQLDELNRQLIVDRMELSLEGDYELPAGWRGMVSMVAKDGRNHPIYDSLVIPAILPGRMAPIGPIFAEVPKDLINSQDEWQVEFYIVDLHGDAACVLRNPIKRLKPTDLARQQAETKAQYEFQLDEKNKELEKLKQDVFQREEEKRRLAQNVDAYADQVKKLAEESGAKDKIIADREEQLAHRNETFNILTNEKEKLRDELNQTKIELSRAEQQVKVYETEIEKVRTELADTNERYTNVLEDVSRLEKEIGTERLRAEDYKNKSEDLQKQLEDSRHVNEQRNIALEKATNHVRWLERELKQHQELLGEAEKTRGQLAEKLQTLDAQLAAKQRELDELLEDSSKAIVNRHQVERDAKQTIDAYVTRLKKLEEQLEDERKERLQREKMLAEINARLNEALTQSERLRETIERLQDARDRATRQVEEQKVEIEGLNARLETNQEIWIKRGTSLVEATTESRRLERELNRTREILARHRETIAQYEKRIATLNDELHLSQSAIHQWQSKFEKAAAGQTLYERYEVIRQLRSSDSGEIYKVCDKRFDRVVTLKVLPEALSADKKAIRLLAQEAQSLAKLNHPNIVRILDFVQENEPYMVMEHVEGRTFRHVIDLGVSLPLDHIFDYIMMICEGLAFAHKKEIYHKNINPEYLVLTDKDFVKIMDFGMAATIRTTMARLTGKAPAEAERYLAPEQLQGDSNVDGRSDIYSVGIVFYELLSGRPPFIGKNVSEQQINEAPRPLQHVSPEINHILQTCLEKKREDRYAEIDQLRRALRDAQKNAQ